MADYWKSQPRKFCQYCKCWIADNKPSIDFHERGKNHKDNVAAKIAEIKKKSVQKAKQEEKASKQFAAMEEAAMKAYEEDLKRMAKESGYGPASETTSTTSAHQPVPSVQAPNQPQGTQADTQEPKQKKQKKGDAPAPPRSYNAGAGTETSLWVEATSDEGYTFYYNTDTGESRWDNPEDKSGGKSGKTATSTCNWTKATSPEGYPYYYNTTTGESRWERPAGYSSPIAPPGTTDFDLPINQAEIPVEAASEEKNPTEETSAEAEVAEEGSKESTVPKIKFRKRKAKADPSDQTGAPPDETTEDNEEKLEEEEEDGTNESQDKEEEKPDEKPSGRFRPKNPYGTWERIKVQKDPYKSVDWQLPRVQVVEETAPVELPPEPKHKFKTRVITSLGTVPAALPSRSRRRHRTENHDVYDKETMMTEKQTLYNWGIERTLSRH
ncbi:hypothetical protein WMY93_022516 [Mugilogobius chulae]|uniref:WW domain-binding protein 4 n=1 Tax=Mugilogobius chulae TaxID=88201 RepID=A0AAW0ND00_9GOBI